MFDTLKFAIPLTDKQYDRILSIALSSNREQWSLFNPTTGELRFRRLLGLAETDQQSFHREILWDIPGRYIPGDTFLTVEFSLPKFWYGHNIHLLHKPIEPLERFKQLLERQLKLTRLKLPVVKDWLLKRADICYSWRCPNQQIAQAILDSLKHLHYPRKKPHIFDSGIMFAGRTYSVKFYLKFQDFRRHDMPTLLKDGASLEWVNYLEQKSQGVLRYEATLRSQYLKEKGISSINQLLSVSFNASKFSLEAESIELQTDDEKIVFFLEITRHNVQSGHLRADGDGMVVLKNGQVLDSPIGRVKILTRTMTDELLQYFLDKFVGDKGMQLVSEVESKLNETYKPIKAARLMSFWLYVQRFGSDKAREAFGKRTFYYAKSDLKRAGVSLVEQHENVIKLSPGFFQDFKLEVPSQFVTNEYDDFRDGDNLLNFKQSAS